MNEMGLKLETVNIKKSFDDLKVIEDVSLRLRQNEFVSLLGLSGSGKSTVFNIISGLLVPDEGKVYIDGEDCTGRTGRVSYMYQKDLLLPWKNIIDNIGLPLVIRGMHKSNARDAVQKLFKLFGLEGFEYKYPFQLSGGMRQRAALMRTYVFSSDIMLLDEPFAGLDAITRSKMHDWLLDVLSELKASVLYITHDIDEAIYLSDRIYVISKRPAVVKEEMVIDLPRPRPKNLTTLDRFNEIKRNILDIL